MTNEGIDVEEQVRRALNVCPYLLNNKINPHIIKNVVDIIARIRAETEAVVTKREREKLKETSVERFAEWWEKDGQFIDPDSSDVPWFDKRRELAYHAFVAAYESNDAGEKP